VDFFARQESARRQSRWLGVGYAIALLSVVGAIDLVVAWATSSVEDGTGMALQRTGVLVWTTLLVGGFIGCATLYKMLVLRGGGGVVARGLGGVRVDHGTDDPRRRRLVNVVEEMAIASGVPVPEIYVLEQETAINALSAGHSPANAAIAVTAGMLQRLNREQLQAVIAHEFSHILNGDMRLSVRLMGLNFGLLALALAGRFMLRAGQGNRRGKGGGLVPIALAVMVLGYLGLACGRVLQAMISRRREHLADASAVQFTRNPDGLKAALLRAAAQKTSTRLHSADAEEVAHMLFLASGRRLLATHPPLIERLQALEPGYRAERLREEIVALQLAWDREAANEPTSEPAAEAPAGAAAGSGGGAVSLAAAAIAATVGDPAQRHVLKAQLLRRALPTVLQKMAGLPEQARAFVLALLLSEDATVRERQLALLTGIPGAAAAATALRDLALALPPEQRLPAVLQVFPALRQLPAAGQRGLVEAIAALSAADRALDVFEFALAKLVGSSLGEALHPSPPHGRRSVDELAGQIALVFAVLARHGAPDEIEARRAYAAGVGGLLGERWPDYSCPADWAAPLGSALDLLRELQPAAKELLMEGLVRTISHDGVVAVAEGELLRTVAGVLQCPLPPLLPAAT
jgi:Zn-dependent protease with chaperone function